MEETEQGSVESEIERSEKDKRDTLTLHFNRDLFINRYLLLTGESEEGKSTLFSRLREVLQNVNTSSSNTSGAKPSDYVPVEYPTSKTKPSGQEDRDILNRILNTLNASNDIALAQYGEMRKISANIESVRQSLQVTNNFDKPSHFKTASVDTLTELEREIKKRFAGLHYLNFVVLNPISNGIAVTFVHESEDKVKALHEFIDILMNIEDDFPDINFEPAIMGITEFEQLHLQGIKIIFKGQQ